MVFANLVTFNTWITDSVLIWDVDNDGQGGEAEDEGGSTSATSILCTSDCDLLFPSQPIQCPNVSVYY